MTYEPVQIIEVVAAEVGSPRNDGTPGSGLYRVPLRLSRSLSGDEARYLEQLWDRPPQFSTMHRPGIASVSGDRLILDGTTVDEVESYHVETLRHIMPRFNDAASKEHERVEATAAAREADESNHREHVGNVAGRISFS